MTHEQIWKDLNVEINEGKHTYNHNTMQNKIKYHNRNAKCQGTPEIREFFSTYLSGGIRGLRILPHRSQPLYVGIWGYQVADLSSSVGGTMWGIFGLCFPSLTQYFFYNTSIPLAIKIQQKVLSGEASL